MSTDAPGTPPGSRGPRYSRELIELREALDGVETVGHPKRETELAMLRTLIERYPDEARQMIRGGA